LEVVDDELVAAIGAERGLHGRGDGAAGVDVADYCAVFGVVAGIVLATACVTRTCSSILLVARLEEPTVGRVWYC
jgi:hypothetical protein